MIEALSVQFRVKESCAALSVSRSGYYQWVGTEQSVQAEANAELLKEIRRVYDEHKGRYGSPRITQQLRQEGVVCGENRVARLMRENELAARGKKAFRPRTTLPGQGAAPNLIKELEPNAPDQVWASDITYVCTLEGWLYLAVILDLFSRRVVGWKLGESLEAELVVTALRNALVLRQPDQGLYFHSDRGSQYSSEAVRKPLSVIGAKQIWRSGNVQSHMEGPQTPIADCLCHLAGCEWHFGEIASSQATIAEAISLAKEQNDMNALAMALAWAAGLATNEPNFAEVDRLASELIELSTRHNFVFWLAVGAIWRGWVRSASGNPAEGIPWIEQGIRDYRATGAVLGLAIFLGRKAEALYLADRTAEALEAINTAEALVQRQQRDYRAELHRLRGVFLAAMGTNEAQIEASFCAAIKIANQQKSISLEKRAEATYAEYRRQKASASGRPTFRLPLW
jgi:putative transposase